MQQAVPAPDLVLFAGDFMAHGFQSAFKKTAPDTSASALAAFADKTNQFLARGVLAGSRSRGEQVWLLSHVPVGIDVFATLRGSAVVPMFQPAYAAELISSLQTFATTVRQGIYGHTHMMEFRVAGDAGAGAMAGHQGTSGIPAADAPPRR